MSVLRIYTISEQKEKLVWMKFSSRQFTSYNRECMAYRTFVVGCYSWWIQWVAGNNQTELWLESSWHVQQCTSQHKPIGTRGHQSGLGLWPGLRRAGTHGSVFHAMQCATTLGLTVLAVILALSSLPVRQEISWGTVGQVCRRILCGRKRQYNQIGAFNPLGLPSLCLRPAKKLCHLPLPFSYYFSFLFILILNLQYTLCQWVSFRSYSSYS